MSCALLPDIPALFCCSPPPTSGQTIGRRAITFGYAGKHLPGEHYHAYATCNISYSVTGNFFSFDPDPPPIIASRTRTTAITLDNVETTVDSDWDISGTVFPDSWPGDQRSVSAVINGILLDMTGAVSETRLSSTQWTADFPFLGGFVWSGTIRATYTLSNPIDPVAVMAPLFAFVDAYPLSDVPIFESIFLEFHPIAGDSYQGDSTFPDYPSIPNAFAGAIVFVDEWYSRAFGWSGGSVVVNNEGGGSYGPPVANIRLEPKGSAYTVIAWKSKSWDASRICQQQIANDIQESCGQIGGTAAQNALGIVIDRPPIDPSEIDFITGTLILAQLTGGYSSISRVRKIFYEIPSFNFPPATAPSCCGFIPPP